MWQLRRVTRLSSSSGSRVPGMGRSRTASTSSRSCCASTRTAYYNATHWSATRRTTPSRTNCARSITTTSCCRASARRRRVTAWEKARHGDPDGIAQQGGQRGRAARLGGAVRRARRQGRSWRRSPRTSSSPRSSTGSRSPSPTRRASSTDAITRGDGEVGERILSNARRMRACRRSSRARCR